VIGGAAEELGSLLRAEYRDGLPLRDALALGYRALQRAADREPNVTAENLEVCLLERHRAGRKFRRLDTDTLREHLAT
jgi:20S proteasome alpha/beta subunit